jgi:hypothetical protein
MQWLLVLAGPASWPVVFVLALLMSRGVDGGWVGMAVMFTGLGVILLIHVIAPLSLVTSAVRRRRAGTGVGKLVISGLCYYGLVAVVALLLSGPSELWSDSCEVLSALFRVG